MMTRCDTGTMGNERDRGQGRDEGRGRREGEHRRRWWFRPRALLLLPILAALAAVPVSAQGWIEPLRPGLDGGVVRLGTDVTVRVRGRVAEVVVEEWFENRGGALGEGDYLYPLPGGAVFSSFSLYQGDQELRGETMDADRARGIYEEIVRRKRDPALIELMGHGLIRARVFPIEAGQRRRITMRYTQLLERAGEAVQFRYAAGARFAGSAVTLPAPGGEATPRRPRSVDRDAAVDFTLIAELASYGEPFSPTHDLDVERRDGALRVRPRTALAGDFSVFLPVVTDGVGISLAAHRTDGEDGYFMLTLSPGEADGRATPRDVTAVVDVSGSMSGQKLEQTRDALHQLLGSLGRTDRFRLVSFSNRVRTSADGWSGTSAAEVRAARQWIDDLRADGGTNIDGALAEALRPESPEDRLPIVVFLTDGLPTVGEQDPERIAGAAESRRGRARIFAFGVGYDVNTYLLDRLGVAGRGSTEYVQPDEDVERAVSTLAAKVTHPVLTDLRIGDVPARLVEIYPGELPDLFAGEELVVFGRYEGAGSGRLRVEGRRGGRQEGYETEVELPRRSAANDYIPRLWASRKLGELTRAIRLNGASEELIEEVRRTALRYGLLSEYTSYLVQEPGMMNGNAVTPTPQLVRPPAPVSMDAGGVASQASGEAAVKASARAGAYRQVASAADLAMAEESRPAPPTARGVRVVGGRTFQLRNGEWVDAAIAGGTAAGRGRVDDPSVETVRIAAFSSAYFDLLAALPELRPLAELDGPVVVAGAGVRIRIGEEGEDSLSPREVMRLVERFRGK